VRRRTANQLPPGQHGLPRGYVVRNQRERVLDAVVNVVAELGYSEMAVEDIIAYAGVSRRTFYEHFANKEDAFLAAYDLVIEQLLDAVRSQFVQGATWRERIGLGLHAFLRSIADEPTLAHVCLVEVFPAGPVALERRAEAMDAFRELLVPGERERPAGLAVPALAAETIVGGIYEVVSERVHRGETATLPELLPDLLYGFVLPFAGRDAAVDEYRAARRRLRAGDA
jgi:AcrR family transcriptional regulator